MNHFEVVGQSGLISQLYKIVESKKFSSAYMFLGSEGMGKKTVSKMFVASILCAQPSFGACGVCPNCKQSLHDNHPDVLTVKTEKQSIGIDEIRKIQKELYKSPYQSDNKIIIIDDAHLLTVQAQNALLKSLEEPPSYVIFILLSQSLQNILPTVLSRMIIYRLKPLDKEVLTHLIVKRTDTSPQFAKMFAIMSEGNPGKAISLAVSSDFMIQREEIFKFVNFEFEGFSSLLQSECLETKPFEFVEITIDLLISWFRDCIVFLETNDIDLLINIDKLDMIKVFVDRVSLSDAKELIEIMEKAKKMLRRNTNSQLVVENLFFEIFRRVSNGGCRSTI